MNVTFDNPSVGFADSSLYTREPGGALADSLLYTRELVFARDFPCLLLEGEAVGRPHKISTVVGADDLNRPIKFAQMITVRRGRRTLRLERRRSVARAFAVHS